MVEKSDAWIDDDDLFWVLNGVEMVKDETNCDSKMDKRKLLTSDGVRNWVRKRYKGVVGSGWDGGGGGGVVVVFPSSSVPQFSSHHWI